MMNWDTLLNAERPRPSTSTGDHREQFERDYDRAVFSSPVKRLQDKAQVFPLEPHDSVRTRLTHSLEVSSVARGLVQKVCKEFLLPARHIKDGQDRQIEAIAATCGLIHDLGNPPFGHSGEDAIQEWFKKYVTEGELRKLLDNRDDLVNDFLLFATPDWNGETDVDPKALAWRVAGVPESLRVIPSSALPGDLDRILPVIFDEERSAFLEARLEYLLAALMPEDGVAAVVFDTPPTIPGLSRSVISLALRLTLDPKQALADDGGTPHELEDGKITWRACPVVTQDVQDLRAADRWASRFQAEERRVVRFIANRIPEGSSTEHEELFRKRLDELGVASPLLANALRLKEDDCFRVFSGEGAPPDLDLLDELLVGVFGPPPP